jgi:APA family basic amino acid/polyamine antiporter
MLLIPQHELNATSAPYADLFGRYVGAQSGRWVALFVVVSGLGALNGWTLVVGEITQTFAAHGKFPAVFGKVNARRAPYYAFVLTGVAASVTLVLNYSPSVAEVFTFLINVITAANLPLYVACSLAVLVLWKRGKLAASGRHQLLWVGAALLAAIYCVWIFVSIGAKPLWWAVGLAAAGIPFHVWAWWSGRAERQRAQVDAATAG